MRAIGDGLPELFEAFSVTLVSADGGGRIADPREARIAIQASDDPSGLIGFEETGSIVISEGDQLMVRCVNAEGNPHIKSTSSMYWTYPKDLEYSHMYTHTHTHTHTGYCERLACRV